MAYEPRRTLLIGLSALAVVFAAALFPAAGVGSHPSGAPSAPGDSTPERTVSKTATPSPTPTPTEVTGEETPEQTPTDTPTATPTETPTGPAGGDAGGLLPELTLLGVLRWLLKAGPLVAVGLALVGLVLGVRGAEPGTPRVHLPYGFTVTLPFTVPEWVGTLTTGVSRLTMGFVVSLSASVTQLLDASGAALRAVVGGLGIALGEGLRGSATLLASIPAAFASGLAGLATLPSSILSLPGAFSLFGGSVTGSSDRPGTDAREQGPEPVADEAEPEEHGPPTIEEAWVAMVELLPVSRSPSTTPTEFARRAVDRGFPAAPIARLTRAFEDVVYGGYSPGERAAAARDALASLRDRLGGDA